MKNILALFCFAILSLQSSNLAWNPPQSPIVEIGRQYTGWETQTTARVFSVIVTNRQNASYWVGTDLDGHLKREVETVSSNVMARVTWNGQTQTFPIYEHVISRRELKYTVKEVKEYQ